MAKYGSFLYSQKLYGTVDADLVWSLSIDWNGDGNYDSVNDAAQMLDLKVKRGRDYQVRKDGGGYELVRPGTFDAVLLNENSKYDPFNTSSEIYPYVRPGVKFKLRLNDTTTNTIYDIMTGKIEDIRPEYNSTPKIVHISGVDNLVELAGTTSYVDTQENIKASDAMQLVLYQTGLSGTSNIENSLENINYWWAGNKDALSEMQDLAESSLGVVFMANDGDMTFLSRYHSAFTTGTFILGETDIQRGIIVLQPWETLRNSIRITNNNRVRTDDVELWTLQNQFSIDDGETISLWVNYNYNNKGVGAINVVTPEATTDYLVNGSSDGNGTDLTSSCSVTLTSYGEVGLVSITNNSGSNGYVTYLRVRGDALELNNVLSTESKDEASISTFQRREFRLNNPWMQNKNWSNSFAPFLLDILSSEKKYPSVMLKDEVAKQMGVDLFDEVDLYFPSHSISGSYVVSYLEHKWEVPNGQLFSTVMKFEPSVSLGTVWIFTTTLGTSSIFAA